MLRTFHSFGAWFLRRFGEDSGLGRNFTIYDDADSAALLAPLMKGATQAEVRQTAVRISRAKDLFLGPEDPALAELGSDPEFPDLYRRYETRLAEVGNADFGDLIKKPVEILRSRPEVLRGRFSVILVDEYQDANIAQFMLLKALAGSDTYVCVVGDDDQSIYRFRGAEVRNILEFPAKFPGAEVIRLESNYRSTAPILRTASSVVDRNGGRLGKTLHAERGDGKPPVLAFLPDQDEEASFCASLIGNSVLKGGAAKEPARWAHWAVLYRTNAQSRQFETEFRRRGIPYRVVGSLEFYRREEVKDALALLAFLLNDRDEVAFRRIVNKPARGMGPVTVESILSRATDFSGILPAVKEFTAGSKPRKGLSALIAAFEEGKALLRAGGEPLPEAGPGARKRATVREGELVHGQGLSRCLASMLRSSGLVEHHLAGDEVSGTQRLANLQELVNTACIYPGTEEGLGRFLEDLELDRSLGEDDAAEDENRVTLITLHNTKGLEFRRVIMTGLEQGIFPRDDKKGQELEEERRLFYVGATRAMDELYLTSCASRLTFGRYTPMQPSLFLREMDGSCVRVIGNVPSDFGGRRGAGPAARNLRAESEIERVAGFRRGQKLFHDDHGYGYVVEVRDGGEGPEVKVRFESGDETRFLAGYQGSAFEKIGEDA